MAYIGNQPTSSPFITDTFSGNNSSTAFLNMTFAPAATSSIAVFVDGVYQRPTLDYTVSGTTLNFNSAPATGTNNIVVLHLGVGQTTTTTVADGAITSNKVAENAITPNKFSTDANTSVFSKAVVATIIF
jgi:hypothetical protein